MAQRDAGAPPPAKARLVLDTLEMLSDRVANLESATAEAGKPDLSHDAQKVQTLEADVKALLALAAKNEASLLELKTRLQKAEAERFPNEVVYGLLALLASVVAPPQARAACRLQVQAVRGAGVDLEDQSAGYGMHGDQERLRESEFQRFVRFNWDLVTRLVRAR